MGVSGVLVAGGFSGRAGWGGGQRLVISNTMVFALAHPT